VAGRRLQRRGVAEAEPAMGGEGACRSLRRRESRAQGRSVAEAGKRKNGWGERRLAAIEV
jgi:hypothetical protein